LLRSTSKRSKRSIIQELSELEGKGVQDFIGGDDHKDWKGGCGEFFFPKVS
jgi:hypothetical protein